MNRSFKFAALGLVSAALAGAAFADDSFEAIFNYNPKISAEANYAAFERTAKRTCAADIRTVGGLSNRRMIAADCQQRIMQDAVSATDNADLTALHHARTGVTPASVTLANAE